MTLANKTKAKPEYIETEWELRTYDVWGNAKDGFEVNNTFKAGTVTLRLAVELNNPGTPQEFKSAYPTMSQIRRAFNLGRYALDLDGDDLNIYINRAKTGCPLGEMCCTSHDSLSPIRRYALQCDQCQMLAINGMATHETGCPNSHASFDSETGEWTRMRECRECGNTVPEDDLCCSEEEPCSDE